MSAHRLHLPILLTVAALSVVIAAGSVFAATRLRPASALRDYDSDTPALKAADLDRALAAGGASTERIVVTYADAFVDQTTLARVHALVGGTPLSGDGVLGREVLRVATGDAAKAINQRSDVCAVPAAGVVAEAMVALVIADAVLEKFGGDSVDEVRRNARAYLDTLVVR
jgi:hypothetical protein